MKKITGALVLLVVIAAVAWAGTAWHAGKKVEERINEEIKMAMAGAGPVIMVLEQKHDRGPFSSEGRLVVGFDPDCIAQAGQDNPMMADMLESMRFTYTYKINHGPRPTSLGWANIEGQLSLDGELKAMLEQFGIPSTLLVERTRVGFNDVLYSDLEMPAWKTQMPDGSALNFSGVQGTAETMPGTPKKIRMNMQGKGLEALDPQGKPAAVFGPLGFKADLNYVDPRLALGSMDFSLGEISVSPMGGPPMFFIKEVELRTLTTQSEDKLVDIEIALGVKEGGGMDFSFKNARYDFVFKRLHFDSLIELDKLLNRTLNCAPPNPDPTKLQQDLEAAGKLGVKMLSYNPEFEIRALGAETSMGNFSFSGRATARDIKEEDFKAADPTALMQKVVLEGKGEVPANLLQSDPRLEAFLVDGLLTLEGNALKTNFSYANGALTLNGKAADPKQLFGREQEIPEGVPPPAMPPSAPMPPRHR